MTGSREKAPAITYIQHIKKHKQIKNRAIAQKLGLTYNVLYNNIKVLGLHKSKRKECKAGYFDIDKWAKEFIY